MARLEVHKFGGTSVGDARRIAACAEILRGAVASSRLIAVASAVTGVTDQLVAAAAAAARGEREQALECIAALRRPISSRGIRREVMVGTVWLSRSTSP